nr:MAG TPA: hypothetical protein [Caudoviricetes sp.]
MSIWAGQQKRSTNCARARTARRAAQPEAAVHTAAPPRGAGAPAAAGHRRKSTRCGAAAPGNGPPKHGRTAVRGPAPRPAAPGRTRAAARAAPGAAWAGRCWHR